jgi:protein SCO1
MSAKFSFQLLIFSSLLISFSCKEKTEKDNSFLLPIIGEKTISGNSSDTVYHRVADFSFTNQYGETVTQKEVENKIYVADFFFATCQSICPVMSTHMRLVQNAFAKDQDVLILSHTVNPAHDSVEVLRQYADRFNAVKGKWHLLTGDKKAIYEMAKNSYLVNALEDDGSAEGFLHSELFLLVDTKKRIRGMYDGTDSTQVIKLIKDIQLLKTEKDASNTTMDE